MDLSRISLVYPHSSPAGRFLRPPSSPRPQVPDVTEPNTGLEWFKMTASTGNNFICSRNSTINNYKANN